MMRPLLRAMAPALLLGALLACMLLLPVQDELAESSVSPDLPVGTALRGWYGTKTQESEVERATLAADTKFSKADYRESDDLLSREKPDINVSIVFSGNDMNNSIHRPERCLPAQGHQNLRAETRTITLSDGRSLTLTRLTSYIPRQGLPGGQLHFTHYYVFIGHGSICHSHLQRTARDMYDRVVRGAVERWAYIQVGTYWSDALHLTEAEADARITRLLADLLPGLIRWQELEG